jgi:hypothetical protein
VLSGVVDGEGAIAWLEQAGAYSKVSVDNAIVRAAGARAVELDAELGNGRNTLVG